MSPGEFFVTRSDVLEAETKKPLSSSFCLTERTLICPDGVARLFKTLVCCMSGDKKEYCSRACVSPFFLLIFSIAGIPSTTFLPSSHKEKALFSRETKSCCFAFQKATHSALHRKLMQKEADEA